MLKIDHWYLVNVVFRQIKQVRYFFQVKVPRLVLVKQLSLYPVLVKMLMSLPVPIKQLTLYPVLIKELTPHSVPVKVLMSLPVTWQPKIRQMVNKNLWFLTFMYATFWYGRYNIRRKELSLEVKCFSNFSYMSLNPNFFPIWILIVLIY